jgi:hypothetical protein
MSGDEWRALLDHDGQGGEQDRLDAGAGALEHSRTIEIVSRHLPAAP